MAKGKANEAKRTIFRDIFITNAKYHFRPADSSSLFLSPLLRSIKHTLQPLIPSPRIHNPIARLTLPTNPLQPLPAITLPTNIQTPQPPPRLIPSTPALLHRPPNLPHKSLETAFPATRMITLERPRDRPARTHTLRDDLVEIRDGNDAISDERERFP